MWLKKKRKLVLVLSLVLVSILFEGCGSKSITVSASKEIKQDEKEPKDDLKEKREDLIKNSEILLKGYYYDEAISLLEKDKDLQSNQVAEIIDKYRETKKSLVKYEGKINHVFFIV